MDESIISGNKLIAEFMGDKWIAQTKGTSYLVGNPKLFHSSWDWLMPVVEKIGTMPINFNVNINSFDGCSIYDDSYKKTASGKIFYSGINDNLIISVWKTSVQFIQWYNQNKKP